MRAVCGIVLLVTGALLHGNMASAAEGMYLLDRLPQEKLIRSGLKIKPAQLHGLSRAVVQVGRGGTGSFVSPKGLLVTNHHVAYTCLARLGSSKKYQGLLDRGYLARSAEEELPCPGYDLLVVEQVQDITGQVLAVVKPGMHWSKRFEAIRLKKEDLVQICEADRRHICEAADLDGGNAYQLSVYTRIRDVRLVYAPPKSLGKYGGDVDNWMFPRHTADATFLRAYVDRQGNGAAFAKDNVPLSTPFHLEVSPHGVKRGSLALVIGFPGRTSRHVTSHAVRYYTQDHLPGAIRLLDGLASVIGHRMKTSPDAASRYAALEAGVQNALKYYRMSQQGMQRWKVLERKLDEERQLMDQLRDRPEQRRSLVDLLDRIGRIYKRYQRYHLRHIALSRLASRAAPSMAMAHSMVKWGSQKEKSNRMRKEQQYKDKNIYRLIDDARRLDQEIELDTEKAILLYFLSQTQKLPPRQRLRCADKLIRWAGRTLARHRRSGDFDKRFGEAYGVAPSSDRLENAVAMIYGGTRLLARTDDPKEMQRAVELRMEVLKLGSKQIARFDDPLLRFARDLESELTAIEEGPYREVEQYLKTVLHPLWVKEFKRPAYPDANFTVRMSLGSVRDYTSSETKQTHRYITSLTGLLKKDRGAFPFLVPERLKVAARKRSTSRFMDRSINDIPVNFTATLDTTGGNSGSPVLDDRGRLVGLLFDGTPESILSDWQYLEQEQRSICVDIRFALFLAKIDRAGLLLEELGL